MFEIGDILQFIDFENIKVIVEDISLIDGVTFIEFKYLNDNKNDDGIYTSLASHLEYDSLYIRKKKLEKLIYTSKNEK